MQSNHSPDRADLTPEDIIRLVRQELAGKPEEEICAENDIGREEYRLWRERFLAGAESALRQAWDEPSLPVSDPRIFFSLLVESIPHAVFAKDLDGRFIYANPAYCRIQSTTLNDLIGKNDFDIHPEEMAHKYRRDDREVIRTGQVFMDVEENIQEGRESIWTGVIKAPIRDGQGIISGIIGMFWDISEQYQAQQALRESEANLQQLIDNAPLPTCVTDTQGGIIYFNKAFHDLFGYSTDEIQTLEQLWSRLSPVNGNERETLLACFLGQESDCRFLDKEGKRHHIQITASKLKDRLVYMMSDVTRLKDIEEALLQTQNNLEHTVRKRTRELLEANNRLEETNKHKTQFLSSVSHELRTPLTSILGFAKMIGKDIQPLSSRCGETDTACHKRVNRIKSNADIIGDEGLRLKRLIDDLLDTSKIDSGQMTWQDSTFDLSVLARSALNNISGQIAHKPGVHLRSDILTGPILVHADQDRIMQVFMNLLNNAAKFTARGRITLSVRTVDDAWAECCVSDTGPGISDQDMARIFEQYYQGIPRSNQERGTGLGLTISHQILKHYEGSLWAESVLGKGTSFFFRLPLATGEPG